MEEYGHHIVYIADEVYIKAELEVPSYEVYEDFPQLEDGIGMIAKMKHEFNKKYLRMKEREINKTVSVATGKAAYSVLREFADKLEIKFKGLKINVYAIENTFFGSQITVSGLITGSDLINQLKDKELGEALLINYSCLKDDENVFLDDVPLSKVKKALKVKIRVVDGTGEDFIDKIVK